MRGRMNDSKSYVKPYEIGKPIDGHVLAKVIKSEVEYLEEGDYVTGVLPWQRIITTDANQVTKIPSTEVPLHLYLSILGMPGMTAYTGPQNHSILKNLDPLNSANLVDLDSLKSVVKVLILTSNNNELLSEKLSELDVYVNKHRNESVLDISPKGIHKWSALKILGIDKGDYIAFGNDSNDISMIENALYTVMVGHHEE